MTQCNSQLELGNLHGKQITGGFDGGDISTDGGLMLVEKADRRLGLTKRLSAVLRDRRDPTKVKHSVGEMIRQRIYQIACGYEDCNDADDLRFDPLLRTAVGCRCTQLGQIRADGQLLGTQAGVGGLSGIHLGPGGSHPTLYRAAGQRFQLGSGQLHLLLGPHQQVKERHLLPSPWQGIIHTTRLVGPI